MDLPQIPPSPPSPQQMQKALEALRNLNNPRTEKLRFIDAELARLHETYREYQNRDIWASIIKYQALILEELSK